MPKGDIAGEHAHGDSVRLEEKILGRSPGLPGGYSKVGLITRASSVSVEAASLPRKLSLSAFEKHTRHSHLA